MLGFLIVPFVPIHLDLTTRKRVGLGGRRNRGRTINDGIFVYLPIIACKGLRGITNDPAPANSSPMTTKFRYCQSPPVEIA